MYRLLHAVTVGAVLSSLTTGAVLASAGAAVADDTAYQMPFPCGQTWSGSTRFDHSPSPRSIDWNRDDDEGDSVVAAAGGIVTTADALNQLSYGHHVEIDHGNGQSTIYAHLDQVFVSQGQYVDQGTVLGTIGNTGRSFGAHLHFEQRVDDADQHAVFAGVKYVYGRLTSYNCVDVPLAGNFLGDTSDEAVVYRRGKDSAFVVADGRKNRFVTFGTSADEPVLGDWDGDGRTDLGVRRPETSQFMLRTVGGLVRVDYGLPADKPVAGDWDGDGIDQVGVFRPLTRTFYLLQADGSTLEVEFGHADSLPVVGDWDGDGVSDLGVYDTTTASFTLRTVDREGVETFTHTAVGSPGDLPVVGDWDGNGITETGAWNPDTATFLRSDAKLARPTRLERARIGPYLPTRNKVSRLRFGFKRGSFDTTESGRN